MSGAARRSWRSTPTGRPGWSSRRARRGHSCWASRWTTPAATASRWRPARSRWTGTTSASTSPAPRSAMAGTGSSSRPRRRGTLIGETRRAHPAWSPTSSPATAATASASGSSAQHDGRNRIGTDPAGTSPSPTAATASGSPTARTRNEIGGTAFTDPATGAANDPTGNKGTTTPVFVVPPLGNLISGNGANGVLIDSGSQNNVLNGNFVGTTAGRRRRRWATRRTGWRSTGRQQLAGRLQVRQQPVRLLQRAQRQRRQRAARHRLQQHRGAGQLLRHRREQHHASSATALNGILVDGSSQTPRWAA